MVKKLVAGEYELSPELLVFLCAISSSLIATYFYYNHGLVLAYGDAESHLNIAKRVISSVTPGFAQLGGVWLPLPHLLLIPFVYSDFLWRSGLAGSIVSGISFVVASVFIYKITYYLTKNKFASFVATLIFISNPNALYMQSTALTEFPLIAFLSMTTYSFLKYLRDENNILLLVITALLGFMTSLVRYDGWFLIIFITIALVVKHLPWTEIPTNLKKIVTKFDKSKWEFMEGRAILFITLSFFGIFLWLLWDWLLLGNPMYFSHSEFSSAAQQQALLRAHQLPSYHNLYSSVSYYFYTTGTNVGWITFGLSILGFVLLLFKSKDKNRLPIAIVFSCIFIFNVLTLYLGQSVIFIPPINPESFKDNIFNVRYGLIMLPFVAVFTGYVLNSRRYLITFLILLLLIIQTYIFCSNFEIITLADGERGVSSSIADTSKMEATAWMKKNYRGGYVLEDDFARPISVTGSGLPMQNVIYIGNKPLWTESLKHPELYDTWVVFVSGDKVWSALYVNETARANLEKYFTLEYSNKDRKLYKRKDPVL